VTLLDKDIRDKWEDGTIPKTAKGEAIALYNAEFGYESPNRFHFLVKGKVQPTPIEYEYLKKTISRYWSFYNPVTII
jgi:hypothetical protein